MKAYFLFIFSLLLLCSCTTEEEENTTNNNYNYSVQKLFHQKRSLEAGGQNSAGTLKLRSYTIDTLELNMSNSSNVGFTIDFQANVSITQPSNELVHVNYLKFINIITESNGFVSPVNSIILTNNNFTYSDSNVDLSNIYPNLFVTNIFNNTIYNPEQIPFEIKHPNYLRNYTSGNFHEVGDEIIISDNLYEVKSIQ